MPTPNNRRTSLSRFLACCCLTLFPVAVEAQIRIFPDVTSFEYPLGASRASGIVGRIVTTRRSESRYPPEREADVSIGENVPIVGFGSGPRPAFLGLTVRVGGRFSLDDPRSALISNDWVAGLHGVVDRGPWRFAAELYHESSHIGDEYAERFSSRRIDWTREVASLWVTRSLGSFTAVASGSYTVIDALPLDRGAVGFGLGYRGDLGRVAGSVLRPVAGVFGEGVGYADWSLATGAKAGVELDAPRGRLGVAMVYYDGPSTQRQFYDRTSRYFGVELRFDIGR